MCCTTPPPQRLLLANHHTTLLYLGHSNVLLLSPLADALCCNLWKIDWEKSEESGRREGVVTGARSFLPPRNVTVSFVILFQCRIRLFFHSLSSYHFFHPSLFSCPRCKRFMRPASDTAASFLHQPLCFPHFYSWVDSCCAQIINEIFSKLMHLKWIRKSLVFKENFWAIDFPTAQNPCWYLMDGPWGERISERDSERKNT